MNGRAPDVVPNIYRGFKVDRDAERDCSMRVTGVDIIASGAYGSRLAILANGTVMTYSSDHYVPENKILHFRRVG